MIYKYSYIENKREYREDVIEADNSTDAREKLSQMRIIPLSLKADYNISIGGTKMPKKDVLVLCGILINCLGSGLPITSAIALIEEQATKADKKMYQGILNNIQVGTSLADSFKATGKFEDEFIAILRVGERSGNILDALTNIEASYEQSMDISSSVKQASMYPIILSVIGVAMTIFFTTFILPKIESMFEDMTMPAFTKAYLGVINKMTDNWYILPITIAILIITYAVVPKTEKVAYFIYSLKYKYNPVHKLIQNIFELKLVQTLGIFIASGLSLVEAFTTMQGLFKDKHIKNMLNKIKIDIQKGESLTDSFKQTKLINNILVTQISTAEESGTMEKTLESIRRSSTKNLNKQIKSMTSLIEPIFTIIIGLVIGSLIIALMLPILSMSQNINIQ